MSTLDGRVALVTGSSRGIGAAIAPETILTSRNRERIPAEQQTALAGSHPIQRLGTPERRS